MADSNQEIVSGKLDHRSEAPVVPAADAAKAQPTGEQKSATPAPAAKQETKPFDDEGLPDDHPVPRKALIEERKKRQQLEQDLAKANGQLSVYSTQQKPETQKQEAGKPKPEDDEKFFADPAGFTRSIIKDTMSEEATNTRIALSADLMRGQMKDFDETIKKFSAIAEANPWLVEQMRKAPNPAKFAYERGKELAAFDGATSLEDFRTKERERIREEVRQELLREGAVAAAEKASTSTVDARGAGANAANPVFTPIPLEDLLPKGM